MENLNLKLNLHGVKRLVTGHPWVRRKDLTRYKNPPAPGELVRFQDAAGNFLAHGYSEGPRMEPAYRVLSRERHPSFDAAFWGARVEQAVGLRRKRLQAMPDSATRLFNGENDGLPGLFCDCFAGWAVLDVLSPGMFRWLPLVEQALLESLPLKGLLRKVRFDGEGGKLDDSRAIGLERVAGPKPPASLVVREGNCRYAVRFDEGVHEGLFLDQRENRARVAAAAGKGEVLNGFCYTGSFSVACAMAGSGPTLNIDTARSSLDWTAENLKLNGLDPKRHGFMREDVFEAMKRLKKKQRRFSLVIQDPPPFSRGKGGVFKASRDYARLAAASLALVEEGGAAFFSCGAADFSRDAFNGQLLQAVQRCDLDVELEALGKLPEDFPVLKGFPEGNFHKAVLLRIKGSKPGGQLTGLTVHAPIKKETQKKSFSKAKKRNRG